LDEKRLQLLEDKLKQLFTMVFLERRNIDLIFDYLEGYEKKCGEKILSDIGRIMFTID
jgi:hypothetical protein